MFSCAEKNSIIDENSANFDWLNAVFMETFAPSELVF